MDKEEQIEILNALRRGQQAFLAALDGITEDLAAKRPGPERWSALECVEHVAVAEGFLLSRIMQAEHAGAPLINKFREAEILARGADRSARPSHRRQYVQQDALPTYPMQGGISWPVARRPSDTWRIALKIFGQC